jgi:NAD(P)-dependent dehydrogenase (short-subunit alcohol dehydrogenase family)
MKDLQGKVAFVTGGASGIGLGQAKALAEENGVKVAMADIQQKRIDEAKEYFSTGGREQLPVHILHLDVTDRDAYAHAADEVESVLGPVQLLFNTAGVSARVPAEKATYDDWDWHLQVNLYGVINGIQTFVPRIIELGHGGHIVNTGSLQSFFALPTAALYTTTKFAIRGLTEALRLDLEKYDIGVHASRKIQRHHLHRSRRGGEAPSNPGRRHGPRRPGTHHDRRHSTQRPLDLPVPGLHRESRGTTPSRDGRTASLARLAPAQTDGVASVSAAREPRLLKL